MISKGDLIRLYNPAELKLAQQPHIHVVVNKKEKADKYRSLRAFNVCTSNPITLIKRGIKVIKVEGRPFKKLTYIRTDPIYIVKDIKINKESLTNCPHRLCKNKENELYQEIKNSQMHELNRDKFIKLNKRYAIPL